MGLVWTLIVGFVVGALARAVLPGRDDMAWWQTMLLGVVGSYVGGFLGALFPGGGSPLNFTSAGFFGSVIGAVVALAVWRRVRAR
ncbi:MAG TPA: GlsB/YeaQ/YmgE family stress response membrane protein [Acidimicrobiia bacterium]